MYMKHADLVISTPHYFTSSHHLLTIIISVFHLTMDEYGLLEVSPSLLTKAVYIVYMFAVRRIIILRK